MFSKERKNLKENGDKDQFLKLKTLDSKVKRYALIHDNLRQRTVTHTNVISKTFDSRKKKF